MASIINATTTNGVAVQGDNSGSLQLQTNNGTTAVTIDTSQRVGINTTSPVAPLDIQSDTGAAAINMRGRASGDISSVSFYNNANTTQQFYIQSRSTYSILNTTINGYMAFATNDTERMRITSGGALLINRTTQVNSERFAITGNTSSQCMALVSPTTGGYDMCNMINGNGQVGVISTSGTSTSYTTSSDYRLKENVTPMTGALAKVAQLKPVTYTWKVDGSVGQGFIAHELQAVVPDCVTGEKDAVDAEGNPSYQGVDTSFLVATLTAAIQELKAELDTVKAELASTNLSLADAKAELNTLKNPPVEGVA